MSKKKKEKIEKEKCSCNNPNCTCDESCNCKNGGECTCGDECNCKENGECTCAEECKCDEHCDCKNDEECDCKDKCCCNDEEFNPDEEEILILKNNIEHLNEKLKQSKAELINYRKRKDEEVQQMLKFANKDLILEMLPILDNFERALNMKSSNPEFDKYQEGYNLLYTHLVDTFKKFGVEEIHALGCEFDPNLHEAVMIGNDPNKTQDEILEVFNKGYILKGRVLRASKVRVNKID